MNPSKLLGMLALSIVMMTTACSKGLQNVADESLSAVEDSNGQGGGAPPVDKSRVWAEVANKTQGAVDGWTYDGQVVVQVDAANQALVLVLPLPSIFLMTYVEIQIPDLPGATIFPMSTANGTRLMAVRIPLKYIVRGSELRSYNTLPNGDVLPFMPAGENNGFAFSFPQNPNYRLHLYVAANAAAVFIETPDFKLPAEWSFLPTLGFPVKNSSKTQVVGYFAVVPNRGAYSSGVYVASRLPTEVAILIDELIRY